MKYIYRIFFTVLVFGAGQIIFGQNYQELQRLQSEYKKALDRQALQKPADISEAEKTASSTALPDKLIYSRKDVESLLANTAKLLEQLKFLEDTTKKMPYVGYEIFTQRDTIPFWQNLPIPKDAFGHIRLDEINPGQWFAEKLKLGLKADKVLVQKSGYFARSAPSSEEDLDIIFKTVDIAINNAIEGKSGVVGFDEEQNNQLHCIDFKRIKGGKPFDVNSDWFLKIMKEIGQTS